MAYRLPTDLERRQLFYYLKRGSSYSACAEWTKYYKEFLDIVEVAFKDTQQNPPANEPPLIPESQMALLYNGYASAEAALQRLRRGDKSVFKFLGFGSSGAPYFQEAYRAIDAWHSSNGGLAAMHGQDFPVWRSKFWPEIERAFDRFSDCAFTGPCWQSRHTDVPASIEDIDLELKNSYSLQLILRLVNDFPELPQPPVDEVLIKTGDNCPFYGIWEPVKAPLTKGFAGFLKRPETSPDGNFELDGCLNYLHQGAPAPTIGFEEDSARNEGRPTVWRLRWIDDRYEDGTIPAEEAGYVFPRPPDRPPKPEREIEADINFVMSDDPATESGVWAALEHLDKRVTVNKGDPMPRDTNGYLLFWVHVPNV